MNNITIRSSISQDIMKKLALRGLVLGGVGASLLAWAAVRWDLATLEHYGFFVFAVGIAFLGFGLVPYRRASAMIAKPHQLILTEQFLQYHSPKLLLSIPVASIEKIETKEGGVALFLKDPLPQKIAFHQFFLVDRWRAKNRKKHGCDCFFPNFTKWDAEKITTQPAEHREASKAPPRAASSHQ